MMQVGLKVFSPIAHCHPIAEAAGLPTDWAFWEEYDKYMIWVCRGFAILELDGWKESRGVTAEAAIARGQGKQIAEISWDAIKMLSKDYVNPEKEREK